jgi:RimJ/RimL family protein N-acetyltransferase
VTGRLVLRPVEPADGEVISRIFTDPVVRTYLGGPVTADQAAYRANALVGASTIFSVARTSDGAVVGLVVIDPSTDPQGHAGGNTEVAYQLLPEYWGQGLGRESVAAAVTWAFRNLTPEPPVVVAITQEANRQSRRLLEAIGMAAVDRFVEFDAWQIKYSVDAKTLRHGDVSAG